MQVEEGLCVLCGNSGCCRQNCMYVGTADGLHYCIDCDSQPGAPQYKRYYDAVGKLVHDRLDSLHLCGDYYCCRDHRIYFRATYCCCITGGTAAIFRAWKAVHGHTPHRSLQMGDEQDVQQQGPQQVLPASPEASMPVTGQSNSQKRTASSLLPGGPSSTNMSEDRKAARIDIASANVLDETQNADGNWAEPGNKVRRRHDSSDVHDEPSRDEDGVRGIHEHRQRD